MIQIFGVDLHYSLEDNHSLLGIKQIYNDV